MIGRDIGPYRILRQIGRGGFGTVFVAEDTLLKRSVAVKCLNPELAGDDTVLTRFLAEAESLARINHPNITSVYSLHREAGQVFMIMEFVNGLTIEALLRERTRLPEPQALALIAQALDGLGCAHASGVIHRDLKPANFMVTSAGALKIMDFGIARVRGSGRMTMQGLMIGTLAYMSPEQLDGEEGDERSDLYALGLVLYEVLSGRPPFASNSQYQLIRAHMTQLPPPLCELVEGLQPETEAAVMRALAKDPADRFQSAIEFAQALPWSSPAQRRSAMLRHKADVPQCDQTRVLVGGAARRDEAAARRIQAANLDPPSAAPVQTSTATAAGIRPKIARIGVGLFGLAAAAVLALYAWDRTSPVEPSALAPLSYQASRGDQIVPRPQPGLLPDGATAAGAPKPVATARMPDGGEPMAPTDPAPPSPLVTAPILLPSDPKPNQGPATSGPDLRPLASLQEPVELRTAPSAIPTQSGSGMPVDGERAPLAEPSASKGPAAAPKPKTKTPSKSQANARSAPERTPESHGVAPARVAAKPKVVAAGPSGTTAAAGAGAPSAPGRCFDILHRAALGESVSERDQHLLRTQCR